MSEKLSNKNSIFLTASNFKKLFKIYWEINKIGFILLTIFAISLALIPFYSTYLWARIIDGIINYLQNFDEGIRNAVLVNFVLVSAIGIIQQVIYRANEYFHHSNHFKWHTYMSILVPTKISSLDFEKFEDDKFNNLMNKVKSGYSWRPTNIADSIHGTIRDFISLVAAVSILISLAPILLPIILIALLPSFFIRLKNKELNWNIWDLKGDIVRKYDYNRGYLLNLHYIKEIRILGSFKYFIDLFHKLFTNFQNEESALHKKTQFRLLLSDIFEEGINIGIQLWLLSQILIRNATLTVGDFNFYISTIYRFSSSSRNFLNQLVYFHENNFFLKDLFELLETENKIRNKPNSLEIPINKVPDIEFKNVSFTYPGTDKAIFKNLSIKIKSGDDIAIVGENGAGKTTFIKLLLRFYDVDEGEILIDGINIKDVNLESWYKNIGVLFQEFGSYYFSVKENISIGDIEKMDNEAEIIEASKNVGAHNFINSYPKKYDQLLSKQFEDGIEPSGGQWQRIALARAFFRNANILILDEPTAAIDAVGEYEIFQKITEVQKEKTTIIISHRFSTVKKANKIYVIENGEIMESGTHQELMNINNGKYKKMYELQAEGYKD